jgi:hypothetical protein
MRKNSKEITKDFLKYQNRRFKNSFENSCYKYRNRKKKSIYKMKDFKSLKS